MHSDCIMNDIYRTFLADNKPTLHEIKKIFRGQSVDFSVTTIESVTAALCQSLWTDMLMSITASPSAEESGQEKLRKQENLGETKWPQKRKKS